MRILVLDDDPIRHERFAQRLAGHEVVHTHGYDAAIRALADGRYEVIYLDHDLDDFRAVLDSEVGKTGLDVARHLADRVPPDRHPEEVIVHSWNRAGARQMAEVLERAGLQVRVEPFEDAE